MTHLSRADLLRWRDTPSEADRLTVVSHLALCDECASLYAELVRTRPLEEIAPALDVEAFAAVGASKARRAFPPAPARHRAFLWALAAAAVVFLAVLTWQLVQEQRLETQLRQAESARMAGEQQVAQQARADQARIQQLERELQSERAARTQLQQELALRDGARGGPARPGPIVSLFLSMGRMRAGGHTPAVTILRNVQSLRLVLDLGERRDYADVQAAIANADGRRVWAGAVSVGSAQSVSVIVPARELREDDYSLELSGVTAAGARERIGEYYFTVLKK